MAPRSAARLCCFFVTFSFAWAHESVELIQLEGLSYPTTLPRIVASFKENPNKSYDVLKKEQVYTFERAGLQYSANTDPIELARASISGKRLTFNGLRLVADGSTRKSSLPEEVAKGRDLGAGIMLKLKPKSQVAGYLYVQFAIPREKDPVVERFTLGWTYQDVKRRSLLP